MRISGLLTGLVLGLAAGIDAKAASVSGQENLQKAVAYLRTVAYNPDLELCREAPQVAPSVYCVASDNLFAFSALAQFPIESDPLFGVIKP